MLGLRMPYLLVFVLPVWAGAQQPEELLREAIAKDGSLFAETRDYTYQSRRIVTEFEKDGDSKVTKDETHEHLVLYGRPYAKLVSRDGAPLSQKDARKEAEKLDDEADRRRKKAEKFAREDEHARQKQAEMTDELLRAFDLQLIGVESLDGRDAWAIEATPRPGFEPRTREAKLFPKMSGRIWIDCEETRVIRVVADVKEKVSLGWLLLQLLPGAVFEYQRTRVAEGVWLPARETAKGEAKILGLKRVKAEVVTLYSNYHRFQAESVIAIEGAN